MGRIPTPPDAVMAATVLTVLAVALAVVGFGGSDITQIMSQVTAMVALYIGKAGSNSSS